MGCSRCHCAECDCLFRLILGKSYSAITAAVASSGDADSLEVGITDSPTDPSAFTLTRTSRRNYKILQGRDAVSTKPSKKFFIPAGLKSLIKAYIDRSIDLVGDKYGGSVTQEEEGEGSGHDDQMEGVESL